MTAESPGAAGSQFRQHLKFRAIHRLRWWVQKARLGGLGGGVHIDADVELMRFPRNISIGEHVALKAGSRICACNPTATISIGSGTTVGYHTFIFASERISIGRNCLIAPFVYIVDSNHGTARGALINQQGNRTAPIVIGQDVWLGAKSTILSGVTIGDGAVIATGAVVSRSVEPYTIVGGIPAKVIGERQ